MQSIEAKTDMDATTLEYGALGVERASIANNNKLFQGANATTIHKSTFYVKFIDWL